MPLHVPLWLLLPGAWACELYLEPASGTLRSTRRSRSSRTLRRGNGWDTCPRSPARGERKAGSGSRSDIDLRPGQPAFSPEIRQPLHTDNTLACMYTHTHTHPCTPHLLRARVHTLLHGHVLDDGAEGESQRDVVRPVETPFEDGAAVWNTHTHTHTHTKRQQKHYIVQFYGYWASSSIRLASVHWPLMKSSLRDSPRVYRGLNLPTHSTNGCSYIPAVCGWPLTPGLHSGLMHRPFITRADKSCLGLAQEVLNCETSRTLVCFFFAHLYRMMGQLFSAQRTFSEWIIEMNETSGGFNIMGFNRRVVSSICLWEVENYCVSCQPLSTHHPHWHTHTHITLSLTSFHRRSGTNRGKKPNTCSSLQSRIPIYDSKELKVMRSE